MVSLAGNGVFSSWYPFWVLCPLGTLKNSQESFFGFVLKAGNFLPLSMRFVNSPHPTALDLIGARGKWLCMFTL